MLILIFSFYRLYFFHQAQLLCAELRQRASAKKKFQMTEPAECALRFGTNVERHHDMLHLTWLNARERHRETPGGYRGTATKSRNPSSLNEMCGNSPCTVTNAKITSQEISQHLCFQKDKTHFFKIYLSTTPELSVNANELLHFLNDNFNKKQNLPDPTLGHSSERNQEHVNSDVLKEYQLVEKMQHFTCLFWLALLDLQRVSAFCPTVAHTLARFLSSRLCWRIS